MAESQDKASSSSSSAPFNITSVIAVLTLLGGILLASKKLASDRPFSSSEQPSNPREDQTVEARLWEDPFKWKPADAQATNEAAFTLIRSQIDARTNPKEAAPILLAVTVRGGTYSEDREARIRSRFAVVSALGESGYAPEAAEHLGAVELPWPATADLRHGWLTNSTSSLDLQSTNKDSNALCCSDELPLSFEWYKWRDFHPGSATNEAPRCALLVWLDEDRFGEHPQVRLALLLRHLANITPSTSNLFTRISLIGPRSSSTLQAMLPAYFGPSQSLTVGQAISNATRQVLQNVHLFCATPSAMDETLVKADEYSRPRQAVGFALTNCWFKSFRSFSPTDSLLAREVLDELKLRNIDLRRTNKVNLVLISEWDTFYGRMLSLTYAAELACWQNTNHFPNRISFVDAYRAATNEVWPPNLHSFVYLRGLDGQTTAPPLTDRTAPQSASDSAKPGSLQDIKRWIPDENKAVGEAQYDYLARLGDRILDYEKHLHSRNRGRINAIGIVGSDVYDTLLLLQALRPRFPEAVFFTTDLDARFWHPKEQDWARNLIVISGYGLQLHPDLQHQVAPFRDSLQTAQYAAALAALGNPRLANVGQVPPRSFEIGRGHAYDLSVTGGEPLHPPPRALQHSELPRLTKVALSLTGLSGVVLLTVFWRPLRRLTWDAAQTEIEALWFRADDIGGPRGAKILLERLEKSGDSLSTWLWDSFLRSKPDLCKILPQRSAECLRQSRAQDFLDFINQDLLQRSIPDEAVAHSTALNPQTKERFLQLTRETQTERVFLSENSLRRLRLNRELLDELLRSLPLEGGLSLKAPPELPPRCDTETDAATHARRAGLYAYDRSRNVRRLFWIFTPILLLMLAGIVTAGLYDTFANPRGEPFLFTGGLSAWPTELLRWLVLALALLFIIKAFDAVQTGIINITRGYRLPINPRGATCPTRWVLSSAPVPQAAVDAESLWLQYQQLGTVSQRICRTLLPAFIYFSLALGIFLLERIPYPPVRGSRSTGIDLAILILSTAAYLFLTFWTMDAVRLCRWLIEQLSEAHTRYPLACLEHFAARRGAQSYTEPLQEWLDLQLIAELTDQVGRLIYYPFLVFFFILLARNQFWNRWTWPASLLIVFALNLCLMIGSAAVLQLAARKAHKIGLDRLQAKAEQACADAAPSPQTREAAIAERLLQEVKNLRKGAFVPFWENPIVGAILVPSGGTALIELIRYLWG